MTLRFLLDTSTASEPAAALPDRGVVARIDRFSYTTAIASPVWHELRYGASRLKAGERRERIEGYLDRLRESVVVLPYDEHAACWHAAERARLDSIGKPAPYVDGQIAAVAATNDLTLVTKNVRDFRRFNDLRVEDWSTRTR
ncbi:MAG: type II toxin-antitoxin system VapC family toxin [Actinomycetota bacterium]